MLRYRVGGVVIWVKKAIKKNKKWKLIPIDQCAYGRLAQKPTSILTNVNWSPKGTHSLNGRCVIGVCAGTKHNKPGDKDHAEQIQPSRPAKRPYQGRKNSKGLREFTRDAIVNGVQAELVQEIYNAVKAMKGYG